MCNRVNLNIIFNLCILVASLANAIIPHQRSIIALGACFFLNGLAGGTIESASIARILTLWGKKSAILLQALDVMYGLGAVIGPFASAPFLIEMKIIEVPIDFDYYNVTSLTNFTTNQPESDIPLEKKLIFLDETTNQTVTPDDLKIVYPYSTVSLFAAFVLLVSLIILCIEAQDKPHSSRNQEKNSNNLSNNNNNDSAYVKSYKKCEDICEKNQRKKEQSINETNYIGNNRMRTEWPLHTKDSNGIPLGPICLKIESKNQITSTVTSTVSVIDLDENSTYGSIENDHTNGINISKDTFSNKKVQNSNSKLTQFNDKRINNNDSNLVKMYHPDPTSTTDDDDTAATATVDDADDDVSPIESLDQAKLKMRVTRVRGPTDAINVTNVSNQSSKSPEGNSGKTLENGKSQLYKPGDNKSSDSRSHPFNCRRFSIVICAAFTYAFANGMGMIEQSFLTKYVTISRFGLTSARGASIEGSSWITHVVCGILSMFIIPKLGLKRVLIVSAIFIFIAHGLLVTTFHIGQEWVLWATVNIMAVGSTSVFGALVAYMETKFRVSPREASIYLVPNCIGNIVWPTFVGALIDPLPDVFIMSLAFCGFMAVLLTSVVIFLAEKFYPKSTKVSQVS